MNFSAFFISRPRFAGVISILSVIIGLIAILLLPVSQYPQITPPQIIVTAFYPGASAEVVSEMVAVPIENQLNGIEDVLYMSSVSTDSGGYQLTMTFDLGADADMAQVKVENRLNQVNSLLPDAVLSEGINVTVQSADILSFLVLESPNGTYDSLYLSNYAYANLQNPLLRIKGVGSLNIYGAQNSMRIWVSPEKMRMFGLTGTDIIEALKKQNTVAGVGRLASAPSDKDNSEVYTLTAKGLLSRPEEFEKVILKVDENGGIVYLKDVARVENGADSYKLSAIYNNSPSVVMSVSQTPDANALKTMKELKQKMKVLEKAFPKDMTFRVAYDSTLFVKESISGVLSGLMLTFLLVMAVVFLFLQDVKSVLIPLITIPVSLISVFAVVYLIGFDINILILFAMILAIGLVVDDSIIVVERVRYLMKYRNMSSFDASCQAMKDIGSPIIATTFVLLSIFIPVGLMAGMTGKIYRQFAVALSTAVVFSALNALTLSPALCAIFLKETKTMTFFEGFNRFLSKAEEKYLKSVEFLICHLKITFMIASAVILCIVLLFRRLPQSFIPEEDQGILMASLTLKNNTSLSVTESFVKNLSEQILKEKGIDYVIGISGDSLLASSGENIGMLVVGLSPWKKRTAKSLSIENINRKLSEKYHQNFFALPAVPGVGNASGLSFDLLALSPDVTALELEKTLHQLLDEINKSPEFETGFSSYRASLPHIFLDFDRTLLSYYGLYPADVFNTLQILFGSFYVNHFTEDGLVNQVIVQSDFSERQNLEDVAKTYVPTNKGTLVQLKDFMSWKTIYAPETIYRFNQYRTSPVNAETKAGVSTGDAIDKITSLSEKLGEKYQIAWTGLSLQEVETKGLVFVLIGFAFVFSYLFLVALYESWLVAFSVLLTNIFAVSGCLFGLLWLREPLSIYAELGIVMIIGLASKNAILIVQFTDDYAKTLPLTEATLKGSSERFRAVIMTALTFILGTMPMLFASGAGASAQKAIGTAVFFGMIFATFIGIFFIPAFFAFFKKISLKRKGVSLQKLSAEEWKNLLNGSAVIFISVLLTACKVGPDYQKPEFFSSEELEKALDSSSDNFPVIHPIFWQDPVLKELLMEAVADNPTYREALWKVLASRSSVKSAEGTFFPALDGGGKYHYLNDSHERILDENYYQAGFDASFEIDLFGGTRRRIEAEQALSEQTFFSLEQIYVSLTAEVAENYILLRMNEKLYQQAEKDIELQEYLSSLVKSQYQSGLVSAVDMNESEYLLQNTKSTLPILQHKIRTYKNALALLTGKLAGSVDDLLNRGNQDILKTKFNIEMISSLPVSVIQNRPDVKMAESALKVQNALVGVAVSELFPKISLSGLLGFQSEHFPDLFGRSAFAYGYTPEITFPIFHFGTLLQQVEKQKNIKQASIEVYRASLLNAVADIKNALSAVRSEHRRQKMSEEAFYRASRVSFLVSERYKSGLISYDKVLNAEQNRLQAQTDYITGQGNLLIELVAFYKSVGGGFNESSVSVQNEK